MKLFETLFGVAVAAAVVPYKVKVDKISEEENAPKKVSVEGLLYRVDITPKETEDGVVARDVSFTIPADGIRRLARFTKEKFTVAREKASDVKVKVAETAATVKDRVSETATTVKDKVSDKVADIRSRRGAKPAAADGTAVIEVEVEEETAEA